MLYKIDKVVQNLQNFYCQIVYTVIEENCQENYEENLTILKYSTINLKILCSTAIATQLSRKKKHLKVTVYVDKFKIYVRTRQCKTTKLRKLIIFLNINIQNKAAIKERN